MKKSFLFMSLLLGLFVSMFALTACGDNDDDDAPDSLAGTEWSCTDSYNYTILVSVKSGTVARVTVKDPEGKVTEDTEYQYSYDGTTGAGRAVTDSGVVVTFVVTGNVMTCKLDRETYTFKRTK